MRVIPEGETAFDLTGGELETFRRGIKHFWRQNKLAPKDGAREDNCPPNSTRTDISRRTVYDPDNPDNHRPKFCFKKRPQPKEGKQ